MTIGPSAPSPTENNADDPVSPGPSLTRRAMLGGLVAGAATAGIPAAAALAQTRRNGRDQNDRARDNRDDGRGPDQQNRRANDQPASLDLRGPDRFNRMFPGEPAFQEVTDELLIQIAALGAPGGLIDAKDDLSAGPVALITDPELSLNNANNLTQTAGTTFVGQFLDHDITRDAGSPLGQSTSLGRSLNLRSAQFDLDTVYGGGPAQSPGLYETGDPSRFRVESGGQFEDLPRTVDGTAIIADPRNDENLMIAGLHVAFLKFHNAVLERVRARQPDRGDESAAFLETYRTVRLHWQWLIVHQFLPQFVGQAMVNDVLRNGRQIFTTTQPQIPVEFQTSAFRMGHSMIRPSYRANMAGDNGEPFFGMVFDPSQFASADPDDMSGGHRAPRRFIGWQTFFDFGDGEVKPNKRLDTHISTPLFQLPLGSIDTARGEPIGPTSLATRNLLRHITWDIASGETVAERMGASRLSPGDLADISDVAPLLANRTPLWLYILREADLMHDGNHLGAVGGRIVAEVFIALLTLEADSLLNNPGWRPTLPSRSGAGDFAMVDLLTIAGVDPEARGQ